MLAGDCAEVVESQAGIRLARLPLDALGVVPQVGGREQDVSPNVWSIAVSLSWTKALEYEGKLSALRALRMRCI